MGNKTYSVPELELGNENKKQDSSHAFEMTSAEYVISRSIATRNLASSLFKPKSKILCAFTSLGLRSQARCSRTQIPPLKRSE